MSECGAPVVTIDSTSTAAANAYNLYVTEYTTLGADGLTLVGDTTNKEAYFLPFVSVAYAQGTVKADSKLGAEELGSVDFKPFTDGAYLRTVAGNAVLDWFASIKAGYDLYSADIKTYDADRAKWDKGELGAKPWVPTQPGAVPTILEQLKYSADPATQKVKASITNVGYGNISQY